MSRNARPTCESCLHFEPRPKHEYGRCLRYPPIPILIPEDTPAQVSIKHDVVSGEERTSITRAKAVLHVVYPQVGRAAPACGEHES